MLAPLTALLVTQLTVVKTITGPGAGGRGRRPGRGLVGEDAYERLLEARELDREVDEAREAIGRAEDSLRLNPRRRLLGDPSDELREGMGPLEHSVILVRGLCRSLVDLDTVTGGRGPDPELRAGRDEVAKAMTGGAREEPGAWQVHGHLLANVDRLLSELDPEGQTWPGTTRHG